MLRVLYTFIVIAVLAALGVWLADNPGDLVLNWRGYELRTSFVIGLGLLIFVAGLVMFAWRLASGVVGTPATVSNFLDARRRKRGFLALSRGMVAVAAGDAADAKRYATRASKLLDDTPLTLLLAAQAAQLEGREEAAAAHFEAMLNTPETAFLGLRGLFVQARRAGNRGQALDYARRAFKLRPNATWAAQAVFEIEAAQEDWGAALRTLDQSLKAKQVTRNEARRRRMVMLSAQALKAAEESKDLIGAERQQADEMALRQVMLAVALDPAFPPAVALAARLNGRLGHARKGAKLIEAAWAEAPHPELADAYMGLIEGESAYDRFKRMQILAGRNRDHMESRIALARAAIGARDWLAARGALEGFIGDGASARPTQRVCELMAQIEEGEFGNRGSAREWLARALHAPEDAAWSGEGWRSYTWTPINPLTGEFDALTWREPGLRLESQDLGFGETEGAMGSDADLGIAPETGHDDAVLDEVTPALNKDDEAEAIVFPPLVPDDPGPDGFDEMDETSGKGRGEPKW